MTTPLVFQIKIISYEYAIVNLDIKIKQPTPVIMTFSLDNESDKFIDVYPELFGDNNDTSSLSNEDLRNLERIEPIIKKSNLLFLVLSVGDKRSTIQATNLCRLTRQLGIFTIVIAKMPSTLASNKQHILAVKNISDLKEEAEYLLIFSSKPIPTSFKLPELLHVVKIINPIMTITDVLLSDRSINLADIQKGLSPGFLYFGEGIAHRNNALHAAKKAISELMLNNEQALSLAKDILIMITTVTELTTKELNIISDYFNPFFTHYVEVTFVAPVIPSIPSIPSTLYQIRVSIICSGLKNTQNNSLR